MGSSGGPIPKRIAPPPPANQNPLSVDVTQSLCNMRQRTNQNAELQLQNRLLLHPNPSLIEEQIRLSPPLTPPNRPHPFWMVKSNNEDINLFPNIPQLSPVAKKSDFSPNIKKVNTHKKVTIRSRSLGSCSSDDSRKSPIDLESTEDPFTRGEQRASRRRTANGLTSSSSPVSSTQQRHFPQSEIDLNEYYGDIELQQQINEIERKLEVEERMHSCLQTMLQVVTGCDAAKEEQLEVRQVACEHEIQDLQNKLQILKGEKDTIFTDQVNESPNFSSPYSTPKRSKNGSPDRVMQPIAAIDTQLEAEERVLIGLESQLEIPLDPVVGKRDIPSATIVTSQDPRLTRLEHRQYVLDEIVRTERDFSKHMYLTCTYVVQACRDANISQMEINILFRNMEAISKVSEVLLVGLEDTLRNVIEKQTIATTEEFMASKSNEFLLEQRAYIKIRSLLGDTPRNIHQDLVQLYGGEACSESTVKKWSLRFREGRVSVEDDPRMGQPIIATTENNIALVAEMCDSDPHITIEQLATSLTLSMGSVHAILTKHLDVDKIFRANSQRTEQGMDCKREFSPSTTKTGSLGHQSNVHHIFDAHGPVCQICTPKGQTVTEHFYATVVLPEIENHYIERRPATGLRGIKILHDNARPHKSKEVKEKIASIGLEELKHPPYSSDLAPCDFWLSDGLKKHLAGTVFGERMQIGRAIQRYLRDIRQEEYKKTFFKWIERLKLVVEHKGDYFEHL
ncbi:Transposase [Oopsacas minuta]|uniref:Transposase n=1 Tax=Oopsacas minuta TaxID=111878 RepID=A0AAV7JF82_9METZ|nr:Transposase [Oopsacas minuta]